jgi:monoterpene epsilon-lactone hydrolase
MNANLQHAVGTPTTSQSHVTLHPVTPADAEVAAAARAFTAPMKGKLRGTAARQPFDDIMGHVTAPDGIRYEADTIGGAPGWWCLPARPTAAGAILYLHGGWYSWGTSAAYRHLVGHIAARAGVAAFAPDYRLAPEHPFPAAQLDVRACWNELVARGLGPLALVGDSAGGGLALALASDLAHERASCAQPTAVVALSPVTDLTLSGASWTSRAEADPYFTISQAREQADAYLAGRDASDAQASPLFAHLAGLPPLRIHVGGDEVLLDDSLRYAERAKARGVDAHVDVWQGLPHVFVSSVGRLAAADQALADIGAFIADRLGMDA